MGTSASPIDPKLDPGGLQNNGGPTKTVLLEPRSPAIDTGDSNVVGLPVSDQRGFGRIVDDGVDVGAYEAGAVAAAADLSVAGVASTSVLPGGLITYTLTVTNNSATTQNNVTLIDGLPAHTTFVSWDTPNNWARTAPDVGSAGTASTWISSLPAHASAVFTLVIQLDSNTPPFVAVTNSPIIGPITGDPSPNNNTVALNTRLDYFSTASSAYELMYDVGLAHLNGGSVSITLPANASFDYTAPNDSTNGANALAVITGSVTIIGNGSTIARTGGAAFRLFDVAAGGSLTLQDLTLQGGLAQGVGAAAQGGAIYSAGTLDLVNVAIRSNKAQGAIGARTDSQLAGRPGSGGGLYVAGGAATLTNDTLSGNVAQGGQGNVNSSSRFGGAGGMGAGGGLYVAAGSVTLSGDSLNGNQAIGGPAGSPPPFDGDNRSQASPGGAAMGGGLYAGGGTVTLTNITLSGNSALGGTAGNGALGTELGTAGTGGFGGAGGAGSGGGLEAAGGTITLTNDTLSGNSARGGAGGNGGAATQAPGGRGGTGGAGNGGGLVIVNGVSATLVNNLIAKNTTTGGAGGVGGIGGTHPIHFPAGSNGSAGAASAPDVSGNVSSSDHDLIGNGSGSNLSNQANGDQVGSSASPIDPKLGPLQNNGGPTPTMALLFGSTAIDKGDNAASGLPVTDERGLTRVVNGTVDIGAFEAQATILGAATLLEGSTAGSDSDSVIAVGAWSASSNASWLHTSSSGTGNSVAVFTFDANPGATRTGTLTIGGQTLTVTQAGSNYVAANPLTALVSSGLSNPTGVAVDASGNVYIADAMHNAVEKWNPTTGQTTTLISSGLNGPAYLAVDGSGNLYITLGGGNVVDKWNVATGQLSTLFSLGQDDPVGVAVDAFGNVYVSVQGPQDTGNAIERWDALTRQLTTVVSLGTTQAIGVAVDTSGNVYFSGPATEDASGNFSATVQEWNAGTGLTTTLVTQSTGLLGGLAVDASGNVYIADTLKGAVEEWNASTGQVSSLVSSGLFLPLGVAVDGAGNVYVADSFNNAVKELPRAFVPQAATFREGAAGGSDSLTVLPATQSLTGVFAPQSDQSWLTVGSIANGVINFSFTTDAGAPRTAHLTVLGQQFTIMQATPAVITVTGYATGYTASPHTAVGVAAGFGNVDLSGDLRLSGTQHTNVGSYTDTWTFHDPTGVYPDASGTVTDVITQAPLTVTATPQVKTAGTTDPPLIYQISTGQLFNGDALSGSLTRDPGEAVGAYPIRQGSLTAGANYALTSVNSVLFITSASDSLLSGQSVSVSSASGSSAAKTTPNPATGPQLAATGSGFDGVLTVAQYQRAPVNGFTASGSYFDVNIQSGYLGVGSSVQVVFANLTPGVTVFWFNSTTWQPVTDASGHIVTADASGAATVTVTTTTSPTLSQLTGTNFFVGTFQPTITASVGPTVVVGAGAPLTATATLAGGNNPVGSITFTLFDPSGKKVDAETAAVNGNGVYATTSGFVPTVPGSNQWVAAYTSANTFNSNASTLLGAASAVAAGSGATAVGTVLYLVGGNTNDQVSITAIGSSKTGGTGVQVSGKLNGANLGNFVYNQSFTVINVVGFNGNDQVQEDSQITVTTIVQEGSGNDQVQLGGGNNTITLGSGNDNVSVASGNNTIALGNGNDQVQAGNGNNTITLGNGNDNVSLGNGANTVVMGNGNDNVSFGNGNNAIAAGNGNNNVNLGNGNNTITLGNGNVNVSSGNGNNTISLGNGNDNVNVGNGNNVVIGGSGNNNIQAGNGDNILFGGLGHDTVKAGNGSNILIDGTTNASPSVVDAILVEWMQQGQSAAADIRSRLLGIVIFNTKNANTLQAGGGLDWFWAVNAKDKLNQKSTDLLN